MADKEPKKAKEPPTEVLVAAEQPPVPVVITVPKGSEATPDGALPAPAALPNEPTATVPTLVSTTIPQATTTTTIVTAPVPATVIKGEGTTLSPTTTEAEDTTNEGQRRVNLIWELTQAGISVLITAAVVYCAIYGIPSDNLANAFFLIIGFYFSRTNHQAIGGTGTKPTSPYIGRIV